MGAAAGEIAHSLFGLPRLAGTLLMIAGVALVLFYPTGAIEKFLSVSVGYLYVVYFVFVTWSLFSFGDRVEAALAAEPLGQSWFMAGVTYAGYNVATIPAVLFCIRHLTSRREAVVAGLLAGPLGMLPGFAFYVAMVGYYQEIGSAALPSAFLLAKLGAPWFEWAFQFGVLLTLVDTGVPILHAINERVAKVYEERRRVMPRALRPAIALAVMLLVGLRRVRRRPRRAHRAGLRPADLRLHRPADRARADDRGLEDPAASLLPRGRPEVEVLVVEAEVRQGRDRAQADAVDAAVGLRARTSRRPARSAGRASRRGTCRIASA